MKHCDGSSEVVTHAWLATPNVTTLGLEDHQPLETGCIQLLLSPWWSSWSSDQGDTCTYQLPVVETRVTTGNQLIVEKRMTHMMVLCEVDGTSWIGPDWCSLETTTNKIISLTEVNSSATIVLYTTVINHEFINHSVSYNHVYGHHYQPLLTV